MRPMLPVCCVLVLAVVLTGPANHPSTPPRTSVAPVGFVNLSQLRALQPLHTMLDTYDREITALARTQTVTGLDDLTARARRGAAAVQRQSTVAQTRIDRIPSGDAVSDRAREARASVSTSERDSFAAMDAYRGELARETTTNLRGFFAAIAMRNQRALAARRQQLREKELTFGFELARRDAPARLLLRLRLANLHLDAATREKLQAQLTAIARREAAAAAAMRRDDEAVSAAYAGVLERQGALANSTMSAQLRSKAATNLNLRFRVLQAEASSASIVPNLPARLSWFASTYNSSNDTVAIKAGLHAASADLFQRFAQIAAADRNSRAQTDAQIAQLRKSREELYRSISAQILRDAQRLAAERHLRGIILGGSRPPNSVDLTGAVAADLKSL